MSSAEIRQPQLFFKGLNAADEFLNHWTQVQSEQQHLQEDFDAASPSTVHPFEELFTDELHAVKQMLKQVNVRF